MVNFVRNCESLYLPNSKEQETGYQNCEKPTRADHLLQPNERTNGNAKNWQRNGQSYNAITGWNENVDFEERVSTMSAQKKNRTCATSTRYVVRKSTTLPFCWYAVSVTDHRLNLLWRFGKHRVHYQSLPLITNPTRVVTWIRPAICLIVVKASNNFRLVATVIVPCGSFRRTPLSGPFISLFVYGMWVR